MASKKTLDSGGFSIPQRPKPVPLAPDVEGQFIDEAKTRKEKVEPPPATSKRVARNQPSKPGQDSPPEPSMPESRGPRGGGTIQVPYVRTDGVETRSTTVHLPVATHEKLRRHCFEQGVSMSHFVNTAVEAELKRRTR